MKKYIDKILGKKYIKLNTLFYIIFILIIKKSNNKLRFYINYRALNAFIILNKNILLLIKKILANLYATRIYNKFDIITIFNEIRIKNNYKKKIFLIKYDLYKYIIIFFKLYNALAIFQIFINNVLKKYLNIFYIIYLNNILIYDNIKKKYIYYMKKILKKL